jgi:hypothetical protein
MKIVNVSDKKKNIIRQTVNVVLTTKGGTKRNIKLEPGHFVYGEKMDNNMPLRIFQQKGIVEIIEEDKPENVEYYVSYGQNTNIFKQAKDAIINKVAKVFVKEEDLTEISDAHNIDKEELLEDIKEAVKSSPESNDEEIEVEVIVPEESLPKKNKGGRPKGSKNKPKRGRPKKKRPVGRPEKKKK